MHEGRSNLEKLFYRIGEVAEIVGVEPHVLRYWETEFRSIRPGKSAKGQRVYTRRDVEKLLRVKDLLRNQGFTIAGAKKKLRDPDAVVGPAPSSPMAEAPELQMLASARTAVSPAPTALPIAPTPIVSAPPMMSSSVHTPASQPTGELRSALLGIRRDVVAMLAELDGKHDHVVQS